MEVIRIDYSNVHKNLPKSSCCIGFFDGLHTGHQALIANFRYKSDLSCISTHCGFKKW